MNTKWFFFPPDLDGQARLSGATGIHKAISQVLINRGVGTPEAALSFLNPDLSNISDPFTLPDMSQAVDRIKKAINNKEKIAIYGDYDVDGLTSTALLLYTLREFGTEPITFIPNRLKDGYGVHKSAIEKLKAQGASLIITVDCGTKSFEEILFARKLGMDVIVTDHHEAGEDKYNWPVVNPKRPQFNYPDKELAGCAIAFFLASALKKKLASDHLDLVALGTVADVVPLKGLNRVFTKFGLKQILTSTKPGIKSLTEVCGLKNEGLKTVHIAFRLAPRINAAGRLGEAEASLALLMTKNGERALELARQLDKYNSERQSLERGMLNEALEIIKCGNLQNNSSIVVSSEGWHPGVIGIVASKISEEYLKPSIVISVLDGVGKGSARSVEGLNIVEALEMSSGYLNHFGGHAQAAGLTLDSSNIESFRSEIESVCQQLLPKPKEAILNIDAIIDPKEITIKLAQEIELLEPFGEGNPEPVFSAGGFLVSETRIVGSNHLKMRLSYPGIPYKFDAIGFGMGHRKPEIGQTVSLAFTPQVNIWNGLSSLQLKLEDIGEDVYNNNKKKF